MSGDTCEGPQSAFNSRSQTQVYNGSVKVKSSMSVVLAKPAHLSVGSRCEDAKVRTHKNRSRKSASFDLG